MNCISAGKLVKKALTPFKPEFKKKCEDLWHQYELMVCPYCSPFVECGRLLAISSILRFDHRPPRQHCRLVLIVSLRSSNTPLANVHRKIPISPSLISQGIHGNQCALVYERMTTADCRLLLRCPLHLVPLSFTFLAKTLDVFPLNTISTSD